MYVVGGLFYISLFIIIFFYHRRFCSWCNTLLNHADALEVHVELSIHPPNTWMTDNEERIIRKKVISKCFQEFSMPVNECSSSLSSTLHVSDSLPDESSFPAASGTAFDDENSYVSYREQTKIDRSKVQVPLPGISKDNVTVDSIIGISPDIYINDVNTKRRRPVKDECVICLAAFDIESSDCLVWSSNKQCHHVFHHNCVMRWLTSDSHKVTENISARCPCCRSNFIDNGLWYHKRAIINDQT